MRRKNSEHVGDVIKQFLQENNLVGTLNEKRLIASWETVMGPQIKTYTGEVFIRNKVLYVEIKSAVLRQELMMGRELLVKNLNKQVSAEVITNIIFR